MEKAFMNHEIIYEKKLAIMRRGVAQLLTLDRILELKCELICKRESPILGIFPSCIVLSF